ncbi:MAG: hypothetical protein H6Q64_2378, partial [Firmicutes bacterium]|nr:hypothetical protein [Bacillota bacterium]
MNIQSTPIISVIVAVFNGIRTLQKCIDSVDMQTYPNRELIIIDGGSNDGTVELIVKNTNKIKYWISESDQGICSAWNKGLSQAKGNWICFLGADDYFWDSNVLEQVAKRLGDVPPGINIAYGPVMIANENDECLYQKG